MRSVEWSWVRRSVRLGIATSAPTGAGVLVIALVPDLSFGYLLALLLAGPLAVPRTRSIRRALSTALLAGWVSAIIASAALVFGVVTLGNTAFMLNTQTSMAPMPTWIPRSQLLPTNLVTWAQQDILFFQPLLAVLLAALCLIGGGLSSTPGGSCRNHSIRLQLTLSALTCLSIIVGWVQRFNRTRQTARLNRRRGLPLLTSEPEVPMYSSHRHEQDSPVAELARRRARVGVHRRAG